MSHDDDAEAQELAAEVRFRAILQRQLIAHPSCRDPDHPGCENCEPDEDGQEEK